VSGQHHVGTRSNGRDFSEQDARAELPDGSGPPADNSDQLQFFSLADDLDLPKSRDVLVACAEKSDLIVDPGDLPATARELRDLFSRSRRFFDRGVPVKVVAPADGGPPTVTQLTRNRIIIATHDLCRPVKVQADTRVPVTLSGRVAGLYLDMVGEWDLPPLAGITTAPVLSPDGTVRTAEGYDPVTQLWCARMPTLTIPDLPSRKEAEAGLRLLRETFRTFPFADGPPRKDKGFGVEVVDLAQSPGLDESTFLVGLLTAICRPNLKLAPGFLVRAPEVSGVVKARGCTPKAIAERSLRSE
jgi:hypothetical protein